MTKFIIDSYAWIENFLGTEKGFSVKKIIEDKNNDIFTHILSIAEISSRLSRSGIDPSESIKAILASSEIININEEISSKAGKLHAEMREKIKDFGLIDSFILLTAKNYGMKILSGDLHFKNFKEVVFI